MIKHDKKRQFLFSSLQSDATTNILLQLHQNILKKTDTIVLISNHQVYYQSDAALRIAKQLDGLIKFCYFFIVIPKPLRDAVYAFIAKNRYRWFGKKETCRMPTKADIGRFL